MSVYKKFTANDVAVIPFNAHKQYTFNSASAASNKVTYFSTRWTSESISLYSSASTDTINTIKYNQLDHLYYKDFKNDSCNRFGDFNYLDQQRELYENANIFSIPAGLYGHQIKPGTFFLTASNVTSINTLIDDSKGNLILSGSENNDFVKNYDIRSNVLKIGPVKGFKKYDLNIYDDLIDGINGTPLYDQRGKLNPQTITSYTSPFENEFDDSYYFNVIKYKDVTFSKNQELGFSQVNFNGSTSEIKVGSNNKFHFNLNDDFTLALFVNVSHSLDETSYLLSKSTTKTVIPTPIGGAEAYPTTATGAMQPMDTNSEPQYPFEVYATGNEVFFGRSDGNIVTTVSSSFTTGSYQHITCRASSSQMEIFINGVGSGISGSDNSIKQTQNSANVYVGNKGGISNHLSGSIDNINIFNRALTDVEIYSGSAYKTFSPYWGNIFYSSGIVTITQPSYSIGTIADPNISELKFQGSHLIYENEYQCTVDEHEFNNTTNISARKIKSDQSQHIADFATGSLFKPYVTTVGLYNEQNELLVVGKLGQPIRCSDETDTTFVLRWDT